MKTYTTLIIALLISITSFAQQGINYKAILKDSNGNLLADTFMNVQFTIHQTSPTGTIVYQEDYNYTTDTNGLLILNIGTDSSPSLGVFSDIDWSVGQHFLQTSITYSGGTINFDATEFMAVPYAKHAKTAEIATNVFSGDYNDLINQPTTIPSGLEQITGFNPFTNTTNLGWRLVGSDPNNYGLIGNSAIDFSNQNAPSSSRGATGTNSIAIGSYAQASGNNSIAMGFLTKALGSYSVAMGRGSEASDPNSVAMGFNSIASGDSSTAFGISTEASGDNSIAMGFLAKAPSYTETAIGSYTEDYTPENTSEWNENDRIFVIGNGYFDGVINRSNALTVLKNGTVTAPSFDISEITDDKALITKEYADATYINNNAPIAYGTIDSNGNILSGTGNFTVTTPESPTFQIEVTGETLSHTNSSTLVTPFAGVFRTASITHSNGDVRVYIFNSSGTQVTNTFQFVIYKL